MKATDVKRRLRQVASTEKAEILQRFFKTAPGEYGEGDRFHGVTVPESRKIARQFRDLAFTEIEKLLNSPTHEERLIALLILVHRFGTGDERDQARIYRFYLANTARINNWDLVDLSSLYIVGAYLWDRSRKPLIKLAGSKSLWERRIAIVSTFYFIRRSDYADTLKIAGLLLHDEEDLIHKATGWMLREVGKRNRETEERFLKKHYKKMPRTMLRYAVERFPEKKRQSYLKGRI